MKNYTDSPRKWESETFNDDQKKKWTIKQHFMFLIDASKPMFNSFNNTTFFAASIQSCKTMVMNLIKTSKNDKIGIMLFGTNDDNKTCPKYINVIKDMSKPSIEFIKILDNLMLSNETTFGQSPSMPLANALFYGKYLINKCKVNQSCSTIMLITCNDQPKVGDSKKIFHLRKILDDVVKNNIDFKLIPFGATFNMKLFYEDIFSNFDSISKPTNGLENIDDIMFEINNKLKHGRSVSKIKFIIDDNNTHFYIKLFNFYTKAKIPAKVRLDKNTNIPLVSINQVFTIQTDELMYKSDLAKYCTLAQEKIIFKHEDISILKSSIIDPGIRLLGFTNKEKIFIEYHFKTSTFIQPNNEVVEDSSLLFNSLLFNCLEMNKVIMCFIKVRQGGRVHLAALIPQAEIIDENGVQKLPSGFHVIYLPFSECVRQMKEQPQNNELSKITDQQVYLAKLICEKMTINYRPSMIKNPKINFHWAMLEALAMELEPPTPIDETLPANDIIENKLRLMKDDIITQLFPFGYNKPVAAAKKRATSSYNVNKTSIKKKK